MRLDKALVVSVVYPDDPPIEDDLNGKKNIFARIKAWFQAWARRRYIKWRDRHIIH